MSEIFESEIFPIIYSEVVERLSVLKNLMFHLYSFINITLSDTPLPVLFFNVRSFNGFYDTRLLFFIY